MIRVFLTLLVASFGSQVMAQNDSLALDLETIVIKDKRLELKYSETSRSIDVIDNVQIERSPALSIAELLQYVAGIDIRRRGINGIQSDLGVRGGYNPLILLRYTRYIPKYRCQPKSKLSNNSYNIINIFYEKAS